MSLSNVNTPHWDNLQRTCGWACEERAYGSMGNHYSRFPGEITQCVRRIYNKMRWYSFGGVWNMTELFVWWIIPLMSLMVLYRFWQDIRQTFPWLCENVSLPYTNQTPCSLSYWFAALWCENCAGLPINDRIRAIIPMKHEPMSRETTTEKAYSVSHTFIYDHILWSLSLNISIAFNLTLNQWHFLNVTSQTWLILARAKLHR